MNRASYFNYIERELNLLAQRIESRGKLNLLDLNNYSEEFYRGLFNILFCWKLRNINDVRQNAEAIDLICDSNKIIIQVSATCSREKIESSLKKDLIKDNNTYCFKFISISKDADRLRSKKYDNPHGIIFNPANDIYDVTSILRTIRSSEIDKLKELYDFFRKELGAETDLKKLDLNLAAVINILSKENLSENGQPMITDYFEIERKIVFNNLSAAKLVINDYSIHHSRVERVYSTYDISGANKSASVLAAIRQQYIENLKIEDDDKLFFTVKNNIQEKIIQSPNFVRIPGDELGLCVNILVVDAFIRCKIFKNPNNYKYAIAR